LFGTFQNVATPMFSHMHRGYFGIIYMYNLLLNHIVEEMLDHLYRMTMAMTYSIARILKGIRDVICAQDLGLGVEACQARFRSSCLMVSLSLVVPDMHAALGLLFQFEVDQAICMFIGHLLNVILHYFIYRMLDGMQDATRDASR
ncbi:hypothetical protein ACJX0J_027914, partial [Zea mays]